MADALEDMDEVLRYVKNHNLSFTIPYILSGEEKQYHPDFIAIVDDGHGPTDPLNQIIEVTGKKKKTRRQRSPRPARFGFRPSTITAALDAGDSSR